MGKHGMRTFALCLLLLVLVAIGVGLIAGLGGRGWFGGKDDRGPVSQQLLSRAVAVLATTENGKQFREAIDGWNELLAARPEDRDLLLNQAVTVLKWIADTSAALSSGSITSADEKALIEQELQDAFREADRILKKLATLPESDGERDAQQAYLEAALLDARARQLPYPEDIALRRTAAEKLLSALDLAAKRGDPQPILAARLDDLAQELQADWPELAPQSTEALFSAWRARPRNLYLLVRAGNGLLAQKDPRALELLDASVELAKPLLSMLAGAKQIRPDELAKEVRAAAESGDWPKAQRLMRSWLNVLLASPAFRSDNRQVNPDILAFINPSFLQRWRQQMPTVATPEPAAVKQHLIDLPDAFMPRGGADNDLVTANAGLVAWHDFDLDGDFDILAIQGTALRITTWMDSDPSDQFIDVRLPFAPTGLCIADLWSVDNPQRPRKTIDGSAAPESYQHDTLQEVLFWNDETIVVMTRGSDEAAPLKFLADETLGLANIQGVQSITPLDIDSDGDLDLALVSSEGVRLLQNNGNRTFRDISEYSSLPPASASVGRLVACDFDRDMDLDLITTLTAVLPSETASPWCVLENILHGQFRFRPLDDWKTEGPLVDAVVAEIDGNASWDWCAIGQKHLHAVTTRTSANGVTFENAHRCALPGDATFSIIQAADLNLDGRVDFSIAGAGGLWILWGDEPFCSPTAFPILENVDVTQLNIQDADGDGRLELLILVDGRPQIVKLEPTAARQAHYVKARIRGRADVNGGGLINHYAIGTVLELWNQGRYQARIVDSPVTHFGLAGNEADNLRIVFNNGLTQNVLRPAADSLLEQVQELKGSCPFVYGWDGQQFQLITDLLWNAPLGLQVARGQVLPDRRWENLLLPAKLMQPRDGAIELRVTEELWEVAYFDHLALSAVDHPDQFDVWTNEKVGPPTMAEPRLFAASRPIRPIACRDTYGRDRLELILQRDKRYVQAFQRQICQGLCEPHSLELHFDPRQLNGASELRLVLTGWLYPTDTSLNIGISQNPDRQPPQPPSLWAPNAAGDFVCVQPFMGFPGGKPKTIVVDLKDVFSGDDRRLRIQSSQQIYWDEAYILADEPPAPLRVQPLSLLSADLHYRGFSRLLPRESDQPHWYDYQALSTMAKWPPLEGPFTRFGDVREQIEADDDRLVVMGSGDEMIVRFAIPDRPLPSGWRRDFILHSVGWDKDADINTLEGQSSLPLPFAAMDSYPPPSDQQEAYERVWKLNADSLTERNMFDRYWHAQAAAAQ